MSEVYIDTSVLLPLLSMTDVDHSAAAGAVGHAKARGYAFVTTSYTIVEATALVRSRLGMEYVRRLGDAVDAFEGIIWVDEALHRRAWSEAAKAGRNGPSLVDWVGFLVMRNRGIDTALAIDGHFNDQGFKTLP